MRDRFRRAVSVVALLAVAGCGGGGSAPAAVTPTPTPTTSTPAVSSTCALRTRQDWALSVLREWYLFPETLPVAPDPTPFSTVGSYIDSLTATARAQRRDRFFTYLTSIAEETAFITSGSSAGFGFRLQTDATARRAFITEVFETAPAFAAGLDRGDEILAIGTSTADLRNVSDIIAAEGTAGVTNALGPSTVGLSRTLRVQSPSGAVRVVSATKADYSLSPLSSRYGAKIIDDGGRKVGYLNLRTFGTSTANQQLRDAFATFKAQGVTNVIVDFRYNGGGLVSTAQLLGDLLGGNRSTTEIFSVETFRPEKASNNETKRFSPQAESISPVRIAFIGTGSTASASEMVINGLVPFFGTNLALIGSNTFGKPVGQVAIDRSACDDRLRVVAFSSKNGAGSDNYYDGLAGAVQASCRATDDPSKQLGDPQEAMTRQALDFIAGRACTAIAASSQGALSATAGRLTMLTPAEPTVAQREVPGLF